MSYKGYVDKAKRKEYLKNYMRDYRVQGCDIESKRKVRLGYLELEVARLQKSLETALRKKAQ